MTISDTRTLESDSSGERIATLLNVRGHVVAARRIIPDVADEIVATLNELVKNLSPQVIITTGGTGFSKRDVTTQAIRTLLDAELHGFGELFRSLSYEAVGPAAMLSGAIAGRVGDVFLFALPGSEHAVQLGMEKLILPTLQHLVWERAR